MSGRLIAASEEDLDDLAIWLEHHPEDADEELRFKAIDFVEQARASADEYPCTIKVPDELFSVMDDVIEDWAEVLSARDEPFHTHIVMVGP